MAEMDSNSPSGGAGRKTAVEKLMDAIGYPERVPDGAVLFSLMVDGIEILAEESEGRIVLSYVLSDDDSLLPELAGYAAGRMLKEYATLACDDNGRAVLWQDAQASAAPHALQRFFESFMDSCDWWRMRIDALMGHEDVRQPETMVIRP